MESNETQKLFHSKVNYKQVEKTALRMVENIYKQRNGQRINLQNIQVAYTAQYQKANNPIKNGQRPNRHLCLNRYLGQEDIQMANKQVKRCSTPLIIREMQIKNFNIMRHHFTQVRVAIIKQSTKNKCWGGYGEKGTLIPYSSECKSRQPLWKTVWRFLKK